MRILWQLHPLLLALLFSCLVSGDEEIRRSKQADELEVTTTVIDILSENVEFSTFLRVLQRHQLIPFLNGLTNITLIAPVNSAFVKDHEKNKNFKSHHENKLNEQQTKHHADIESFSLEDLKRYILTEPVISGDFRGTHVFSSYYKGSPVVVNADRKNRNFEINGLNVVEPDLLAESQDSVVQGIENLFHDPKPATEVLKDLKHSSIFEHLSQKHDLSNQTLLIPIDQSFQLKDYEFDYLLSDDYGKDDLKLIVDSLTIPGIYGGDVDVKIHTKNDLTIKLSSPDNGVHLSINDSIISTQSNILAEDAIIHRFNDTSLIPEIKLNPLKVLVGLNASDFVDELFLHKLSDLITDNSIKQTIFVTSDSNQQFSIASKSSNLYHFIDEKITSFSKSRTLYTSKFCNSKKMGSSCQKVKIEQTDEDQYSLNGNVAIQSGPYEIGETIIYLTDDDLRTPNELVASINPIYHCSKSLKYMQKLGILKLSNNNLGYSFFLPCYDSWDDFELTSNYLQQNTTALSLLMKHFVINGLFYSDFEGEDAEFENLNGNSVKISNEASENGKVYLKYNGVEFDLDKNDDVIFNQGVIHPIDKVFFPNDLDIGMRDIIQSSDDKLFLDFLKNFPIIDNILDYQNFSILLPSTKSLEKIGSFDSNATLEKFLKLHIIAPASLDNLYNCSGDIQTLLGVNLTCSRISSRGDFFLQTSEDSDHGVRVLSKGCTGSGNNNCVFSIDRPISLSWLEDHQHYHLTLPGITLAIGVLMGVVVMIFVFVCLMLFVASKRNSFIFHVEQGSGQGPDENSSLLNNERSNNVPTPNPGSSFAQNYSNNSHVTPISVSQRYPSRKANMN